VGAVDMARIRLQVSLVNSKASLISPAFIASIDSDVASHFSMPMIELIGHRTRQCHAGSAHAHHLCRCVEQFTHLGKETQAVAGNVEDGSTA
jgi:hypothetical protein